MSDTKCLLSVFHFLLIENNIAINVDTNRTNTMSWRPNIEDVQYAYNECSTLFFRLSTCWEDDKYFSPAQLHNSLYHKRIPKRFFLFDVRKIISVESGTSNKCATIKVDYDENGGICKVDICLNDYVSDKVKISNSDMHPYIMESHDVKYARLITSACAINTTSTWVIVFIRHLQSLYWRRIFPRSEFY